MAFPTELKVGTLTTSVMVGTRVGVRMVRKEKQVEENVDQVDQNITPQEQPSGQTDVNAKPEAKGKETDAERTKKRLVQLVFPVGMESVKSKLVEIGEAYNISIPQAFMEVVSGKTSDEAWKAVSTMVSEFAIDEVRKASAVHEPKAPKVVTADSVKKQIAKLSDEEREALRKELLAQLS